MVDREGDGDNDLEKDSTDIGLTERIGSLEEVVSETNCRVSDVKDGIMEMSADEDRTISPSSDEDLFITASADGVIATNAFDVEDGANEASDVVSILSEDAPRPSLLGSGAGVLVVGSTGQAIPQIGETVKLMARATSAHDRSKL